jgi:hypothetical protein
LRDTDLFKADGEFGRRYSDSRTSTSNGYKIERTMKALSATPSHKMLCGHSETTKDLYRVSYFDSRQSNGTEGVEEVMQSFLRGNLFDTQFLMPGHPDYWKKCRYEIDVLKNERRSRNVQGGS